METRLQTKLNINLLEKNFIDYVDVSEKTIENYKDGLENFFRYITNLRITNPTRNDIISWRNMLRDEYAPSTVNSYLTSIKVFFRFLEQNNIYSNITKDVKGSKVSTTPKKQVLSVEQAKIIYNSLQDKREKAIFGLLITTGLRGVEVANAKIEDIQQYNGETVLWVKCKKHYAKDEYVKLADNVLEDLKEYLNGRKEGYLFVSTSNNNKNGGITTKTIRLIIKNIFKRFGLDSDTFSTHSIRRSAATIMYQAGQDIYSIQQVLHHKSQLTTTRYINSITRNNNNSENLVASLITE